MAKDQDSTSPDSLADSPNAPDFGHPDWFVETPEDLAKQMTEQCVQCYYRFPATAVEDGLCRDCHLRALPGRSILEEVSAIRRKVRNWMLLIALVLALIVLIKWLAAN